MGRNAKNQIAYREVSWPAYESYRGGFLVMFTKHYPIHDQIKVFLYYDISLGHRNGTYNFWLEKFVKLTGVTNVYDIEEEHVESFLTDVSVLYNGQYALNEAEKAIRALRRYYQARGRNINNRGSFVGYNNQSTMQENVDRNRRLVLLREQDPHKWSWRALGKEFKIHFTTAREIHQTQSEKYLKSYPQAKA